MDWGDGDYELTAAALEPAARRAVDAAGVSRGTRVLDLGCGTGNAALEAARRGAEVVAIDPARRLLDVCRERAASESLSLRLDEASADRLPFEDASFDAVVSVFAVIFAPEAGRAATEMMRVVRPGGVVVVTSWLPTGPIAEVGRLLQEAMTKVEPARASRSTPAWGDPSYVERLFAASGARAQMTEERLVFESDSAEVWLREQERHHPAWRMARAALGAMPGEWDRLRAQSLAVLRHGSEVASDRMRITSRYLLIVARRPEP